MSEQSKLFEAILNGDTPGAKASTDEMLAAGVDPKVILNDHMIVAMEEVGRRFECNEYFVPEMLIAARAMKAALAIIRPRLAAEGESTSIKVAIGTVKGDLHDIGKNLVASMLEGGGFEIVDLGVDVSPEKFIAAVKEQGVKIVALSALLTTTMPSMKTTIDALQEAGIRDQVKVIIGGAPVTQQYADQIGADGFSTNANGAVTVTKQLLAGVTA
jgi:corrinoid protein of di/trimethylamine methyltransferase